MLLLYDEILENYKQSVRISIGRMKARMNEVIRCNILLACTILLFYLHYFIDLKLGRRNIFGAERQSKWTPATSRQIDAPRKMCLF